MRILIDSIESHELALASSLLRSGEIYQVVNLHKDLARSFNRLFISTF